MVAFVPDFMMEWWFMGLMVLFLLGLIGALVFMRNKSSDDDD